MSACGGARAFGRQIAFRAHERERGLGPRDQADVRELGNAVHEDDVRGLDVAVNEAVAVQVVERGGRGRGRCCRHSSNGRRPRW